MAGEDRAASGSLNQRLEQDPYRFNFFQAVRLLECQCADKPRVGTSQRPSDDPVRFGQEPSLAFPASTLTAYYPAGSRPARMLVSFLGLLGPQGPLPLHLTEYARERLLHSNDPTFSRFLDVFNHRMVSLFYRAWACNQQAVSYDRPNEDRYGDFIGSIFGIGMESFRKRDAVPDLGKLHYAGRLSCPTRHAEGLGAILGEFFGVKAQIDQFVGHWINLSKDSRCLLGHTPQTATLGRTAVLGSRIWDCQQKFRVKLGPMHFDDYRRMLPGTESFKRLVAWVRNYIGDELSWDLHLILKAAEAPKMSLGRMGELGWSSWLASKPLKKDAVITVSDPMSSVTYHHV